MMHDPVKIKIGIFLAQGVVISTWRMWEGSCALGGKGEADYRNMQKKANH
jgi:hypothetical protein